MAKYLDGKNVLITGGTGSLGKVLLRRLLTGEMGTPEKIVVFSRDEGKQHAILVDYLNAGKNVTDEVMYSNFKNQVRFVIGDVRNENSISDVLQTLDINVVVHAAAMKQVPSCEYFPEEAALTNVMGAANLMRAIRKHGKNVESVIAVSTDKACKPVNVMGMSKSMQERIMLQAAMGLKGKRIMAVRYGNVLASRGSVIPLFHELIRKNNTLTITHADMTRFLLSLDDAVNIIFEAMNNGLNGEMYIPQIPAAKVTDIAEILIGNRGLKTKITGIRPGEKLHEILISEEEGRRCYERNGYYVIPSILPEISDAANDGHYGKKVEFSDGEYSSETSLMSKAEVAEMLKKNNLLVESDVRYEGGELIA